VKAVILKRKKGIRNIFKSYKDSRSNIRLKPLFQKKEKRKRKNLFPKKHLK